MTEEPSPVLLSELQVDVMRILWLRGEAATPEVVEFLSETRGLAHTTVSTILTRLEKKGIVRSRRDGRQLLYQACISEQHVRRSMVGALLSSVFDGDPRALLAHLVKEDGIRASDLEYARGILKKAGGKE